MPRVILDAITLAKLNNLREPLELCDESGAVLARLTPLFDPSQWESCEPEMSEEEFRRRERSGKWYTTAEILARLQGSEGG